MSVSVSSVEAARPEALTTAAGGLGAKITQLNTTIDAQRKALGDLQNGWHGMAANAALARAGIDLSRQIVLRDRLMITQQVLQTGGSQLTQVRSAVVQVVGSLRAQGWQVSDDGVAIPPPNLPEPLKGTAAAWTAIIQRLLTIFDQVDSQTAAGLPDFGPLSTDFKQSPEDGDDRLAEILEEYQVGEDPGGTHEIDFPAWVDKIARKEIPNQELTATEIRMLLASPTKVKDVFDIKEEASAEAVKRFPPPDGVREIDNQTDAFRHAYANALMTQKFGEEWTRKFATAHEGRENNYASSEAMDLYNNEIGRQIAVDNPNASPEELADLVQQAVNDGDTVVIRPDGQGLQWSNSIAPIQTGDSSRSAPVDGSPQPSPYGS
jgi:hypothetical protein